MSIHTHIKLFVPTVVVLLCADAFAETPDALVKQALQQNPELNFFVAEIGAAKGGVRTAGTIRNPELSSEFGYKNSRENAGGSSGDGAIVAL
jgi:outer membrane protein TolC